MAEQVLLLENIATSLKTGPDQLPTVYNLLVEAVRARRLGVAAASLQFGVCMQCTCAACQCVSAVLCTAAATAVATAQNASSSSSSSATNHRTQQHRTPHLQADVLQMEPPELYVRQNPVPNAYTLAISGRKPFIVLHTSLLELLSEAELQAVIAHGERGAAVCGRACKTARCGCTPRGACMWERVRACPARWQLHAAAWHKQRC